MNLRRRFVLVLPLLVAAAAANAVDRGQYENVPEHIKKWWGPAIFTAPTVKIDFRVGGKYLYSMLANDGTPMAGQEFWSTGTYEEIVPLKKIVATDHFSD